MAVFTTDERSKEISIRKVLGSSVKDVIVLIGREFTLLVFIGFLIAIPVAVYLLQGWLDQFAYRVEIGIGAIALSGALAILVAWITIGFNTLKAALSNPVNYLRNE